MQTLAKMEIGAAGETWEEVEQELKLPQDSLTATSCGSTTTMPLRARTRCFDKARKSGSSP